MPSSRILGKLWLGASSCLLGAECSWAGISGWLRKTPAVRAPLCSRYSTRNSTVSLVHSFGISSELKNCQTPFVSR